MDIVIYLRRRANLALCIADTDKGKRWLHKNMVITGGAFWTAVETVDEVVKLMEEDELRVEVIG